MVASCKRRAADWALTQWLNWLETLHPVSIDLGLERVARVADSAGLLSLRAVVVSVAGTNGKGSSIAMLEAIYRAGGYHTAAYTSPHLRRYNERLRLDGAELDDAAWCDAFAAIDGARADTSLTYFEFGTLAALWLIRRHGADVALLEVGLGGRLDAVNIIDPDMALITTIALDHQQWLGAERDTIATEKAGILRVATPAVFGEREVPATITERARQLGVTLRSPGHGFNYVLSSEGRRWNWSGAQQQSVEFPLPTLPGAQQVDNAAAVLSVVETLQPRLPLSTDAIATGLQRVRLPGRMQVIEGVPLVVLDVAHNPHATAALAAHLAASPPAGVNRAVIAVLDDKDLAGMLTPLLPLVADWYCSALPECLRALPVETIVDTLSSLTDSATVNRCPDPQSGLDAALAASSVDDRIVVFGSFFTVAAIERG